MTRGELADWIVIMLGVSVAIQWLAAVLTEMASAVDRVRQRRHRARQHTAFVAARVKAREETEARLRAEGRWDNYEIQDAMDAAGHRAAPGYRP